MTTPSQLTKQADLIRLKELAVALRLALTEVHDLTPELVAEIEGLATRLDREVREGSIKAVGGS